MMMTRYFRWDILNNPDALIFHLFHSVKTLDIVKMRLIISLIFHSSTYQYDRMPDIYTLPFFGTWRMALKTL